MAPLATGLATSIGSLPHTDPEAAAAFVLDHHPGLPAAPSLPRRDAAEGMLAQAVWGIPGVGTTLDGAVTVVKPGAVDPDAVPGDAALAGEAWVGLRAFLARAATRTDRRGPVKLQLTGPVTLGMALVQAGVPAPRAFAAAGTAVKHRIRHLLEAAWEAVPGAPVVLFLDEPWFGVVGDPDLGLLPAAATDLLEGALRGVGFGVTTGVHCCAEADWAAILHAEPDVLSLPVERAGRLRPGDVKPHLERGGWLAWGVVPTTGPLPGGPTGPWTRVAGRWHDLVAGGCDPVLVRTHALVTPACGLAGHSVASAARVLDLTTAVARRLAEGAVTARQ